MAGYPASSLKMCARQCCGCLPQQHDTLNWPNSAVQVWCVYTQRTRSAHTHRRVSVPDVDPLLEAPLMDLLVNGHDQIVRDPSFLDMLQGKGATASALWDVLP